MHDVSGGPVVVTEVSLKFIERIAFVSEYVRSAERTINAWGLAAAGFFER